MDREGERIWARVVVAGIWLLMVITICVSGSLATMGAIDKINATKLDPKTECLLNYPPERCAVLFVGGK